MDNHSKEQFNALATPKSSPCVSIYIPTHKSGVQVNEKQDAILFKNQLQKSREILAEKGYERDTIETLMKPGVELLDKDDFWRNQLHGLAVFLSPDFFKIIRLPQTVKETLIINNTFYLAPVLPILADRCRFYLLMISRKDAKLFECDQYQMQEVPVAGLPNGMDDVIHYEEKSGQQLFRKGGTSAGGEASYHGHGAGIADDREYVHKYLKEVDQTLWTEILGRQQVPLLLCGVDYLVAAYKQVSHYKYIWDEYLTGNFEYEQHHSLFEKAKEVMKPFFKEKTDKALTQYYNHSESDLTVSVPEDTLYAAFYAQVSDLFVEKDQHIWGHFDEHAQKAIIHDEAEENDDCLINQAIIKTLENGGDVHILEKDKMPVDSKIAAFLRF